MKTKYEKAIFVSDPLHFADIIRENKDCHRIYCGNEFCQFKFIHDAGKYQEIAKQRPVSLVLPAVITPQYFGKIEKIIDKIMLIGKNPELVINSFGLCEWYSRKKRKYPAVMGRMISHFTLAYKEKFRQKNVSTEYIVGKNYIVQILDQNKVDFFVKKYNIVRFEISVLPNIRGYVVPKNVNVSLYYPYAVMTVTRNCVFRPNPEQNTADKFCARECGSTVLELDHPASVQPFLMVNNGYVMDCNIKEILTDKIDRYVNQIL